MTIISLNDQGHSFKLCSSTISPSLSHFYNLKRIVRVSFEVGGGSHWPTNQTGQWLLPPTSNDTDHFFLPYKNGSNLLNSLLSTIWIYAELFGNFDFKNDSLFYMVPSTTYLSTSRWKSYLYVYYRHHSLKVLR